MIRGAIFDVDGTILDSMPIWDTAAQRYLKTLGITADKELGEILFPMSLEEGAVYVKERFHLSYSVEKIVSDITGVVEDFYRFEAPLKEGVREVLEWLSGQQVKMAVATSGEKRLVEAAFERTGILQFFEGILTGADVGVGKTQPDIFYKAAQMTESQPCETLVFEDAFHAIRTAREAGFIVIGVYDESDIGQNTLIREYSNLYCEKMNECIIELQELLFTGTIPRSVLPGTE